MYWKNLVSNIDNLGHTLLYSHTKSIEKFIYDDRLKLLLVDTTDMLEIVGLFRTPDGEQVAQIWGADF